jgi:hypothetical protein
MNEIVRYHEPKSLKVYRASPLAAVLRQPTALEEFKAEVEPCTRVWLRLLEAHQTQEQLEAAIKDAKAMIAAPRFQKLQRYARIAEQPASKEDVFALIGRLVARAPGLDPVQRSVIANDMMHDVYDDAPKLPALELACRKMRKTTEWLDEPALFKALEGAQAEIDNLFYSTRRLPGTVDERERKLENQKAWERWAPFRPALSAFCYSSKIPAPDLEDGVRKLYDHEHGAGAYDRRKAKVESDKAEETRKQRELEERKALESRAKPIARQRFDAYNAEFGQRLDAVKGDADAELKLFGEFKSFFAFLDEEVDKLRAAE